MGIEHIQEAKRLMATFPTIMRELYNADSDAERNAWAVIYDARVNKANTMLDIALATYPVEKPETRPEPNVAVEPVQTQEQPVIVEEPKQEEIVNNDSYVVTDAVENEVDSFLSNNPEKVQPSVSSEMNEI